MRVVETRAGCATVACPTCESHFVVELDEDAVPCAPEVTKCHVEGCQSEMCDECRAVCFACDAPSCNMHLVEYAGDRYCPCCMAEMAAEGCSDLVGASL